MMEKSFLFDVVSRIYVATDVNPVHMATYELCCDMIDLAIDVSCIYGVREEVTSISVFSCVARVRPIDLPQILSVVTWDISSHLSLVRFLPLI